MPGVHAVITAKDMPGGPPIIPMRLQPLPEFKPFEQPVIAADKVRYVGEPIAVVLADSAAIAEDALEAIAVDIEALPAVTDRAAAEQRRQPAVRANSAQRRADLHAPRAATPTRRSSAPYRRRERFKVQRHYGLTMEPRGVLAEWDAARRHPARCSAPPRCRSSTAGSWRRRSACPRTRST